MNSRCDSGDSDLLLVRCGAEEHERLRDAPRLVELVLRAIEHRERLVQLDAIRRVREQELQLRDRLVTALRRPRGREIRELLVARDVVGRELARDLVRLGRGLGVAEVIEADVAEPRPQLGLLVGVRVVAEPLELAAIRAREVLVVLAIGEQLVDRLERLRRGRRASSAALNFSTARSASPLVARNHGRGVMEARAAMVAVSCADSFIERLDARAATAHPSGERLEQLVQQHARRPRELEPFEIRADRRADVLEALTPDVANLLEQLGATQLGVLALGQRLDLRALRVGDRLPLAVRAAELDHRLERRLVQRLALERAPEVRLRFLVVAERARGGAEAIPNLPRPDTREQK